MSAQFAHDRKDEDTLIPSDNGENETSTELNSLDNAPKKWKDRIITIRCKLRSLLIVFSIIMIVLLTSAVYYLRVNHKGISSVKLTTAMSHCLSNTGYVNEQEFKYLAVATLIKNKRKYLREWLEFHLMQGFSYFILYDNESEDGMKEFLDPYITEGIVYYMKWPPKEQLIINWEDPQLQANFIY